MGIRIRPSLLAVGTAIAVAVGIIAVSPATSAAAPEKKAPNISTSTSAARGAAEQKAVENYWTPERMKAAKPVELADPSQKKRLMAPTPVAEEQAVPQSKVDGAAGDLSVPSPLAGNSTADPVARPYTSLPNRLNGKVFFRMNGWDYVCSGTLVNSANKDMVDTAGHCVSTGSGGWVTKWAFVPAYSSSYWGEAPYGVWPSRELTTRSEWFYNGNLKQDLGYGVLATRNGVHAVNWLGGQGTLWNYGRSQYVYEFGYPAADQRLNVSWTSGSDDPNWGRPGPGTLRINSPQTPGTSGGGWLAYLGWDGVGYVNSHSSYRYESGPKANAWHLYGPYYGNELASLFGYAQTL